MRGESCTPPPPRGVTLVAGAWGSKYGPFKLFYLRILFMGSSLEQETLSYNAI